MFASVFNKAENAAHELARDAGITLLVVVLQCGAVLFVFGGIAWGLTYLVAPPIALILTGAALGVTAAITLAVKRNDRQSDDNLPVASPREEKSGVASTASSLLDSLTSVAGTFDVVAAGMFTRQLQRRPVSTIAATVAVGMLLGILADAGDDGD